MDLVLEAVATTSTEMNAVHHKLIFEDSRPRERDLDPGVLAALEVYRKLYASNEVTRIDTVTRGKALKEFPYFIGDEEFVAELFKGEVIINHPIWSLQGSGATLLDAEISLRQEAQDVSGFYLNHPVEKMSPESINFIRFLARIITSAE